MLVQDDDGRVYWEFFSSSEREWIRQLAPAQYQHGPLKWTPPKPRQVAPTESVSLFRWIGDQVVAQPSYWQLVPPWVREPTEVVTTRAGTTRLRPPPRTHFNSRMDTLISSPGWRRMLAHNRGVVFADAFFEWSDEDLLQPGQPKLAGRFELTGGRLMALAAIWSEAKTPDGLVPTCSIVTTGPNAALQGLPHHRMPAILHGEELFRWLDPKTEHPERLVHPTLDDEIVSTIVPASQFKELTPRSEMHDASSQERLI